MEQSCTGFLAYFISMYASITTQTNWLLDISLKKLCWTYLLLESNLIWFLDPSVQMSIFMLHKRSLNTQFKKDTRSERHYCAQFFCWWLYTLYTYCFKVQNDFHNPHNSTVIYWLQELSKNSAVCHCETQFEHINGCHISITSRSLSTVCTCSYFAHQTIKTFVQWQ